MVRLLLAVAETRLVGLLAAHGSLVVAKTIAKEWQDDWNLHGDGFEVRQRTNIEYDRLQQTFHIYTCPLRY